jgi:adenylate cyclase class 2
VEIEKKYRLSSDEQERLRERLRAVGATPHDEGEEFEENILYAGRGLDTQSQLLRLRRVGGRAILTYKECFATSSDAGIKHRREDETRVENPDALAAILDALGYKPALVYEKRRATWHVADVEVVVDELPFGLFVEIEGEEHAINAAEDLLQLTETDGEHASYPELTARHGTEINGIIQARFQK